MSRPARPGREHLELTREAGYGRLSLISIIAGLIAAYGAFAIVASVVGAILTSVDVDTEFRSNDWTGSGAVASLVTAAVLLVSYFFGGYVAGRMGRRSAVAHGVCVFIGSLLIAAVVSGVVALLSDDGQLQTNLRSVGIPTSTDQVSGVALTGVIVSLAAMLVGSVAGAVLGERWHTKLSRRAADPTVGPAAERAQRQAAEQAREEEIARERHAEPSNQVDPTGGDADLRVPVASGASSTSADGTGTTDDGGMVPADSGVRTGAATVNHDV